MAKPSPHPPAREPGTASPWAALATGDGDFGPWAAGGPGWPPVDRPPFEGPADAETRPAGGARIGSGDGQSFDGAWHDGGADGGGHRDLGLGSDGGDDPGALTARALAALAETRETFGLTLAEGGHRHFSFDDGLALETERARATGPSPADVVTPGLHHDGGHGDDAMALSDGDEMARGGTGDDTLSYDMRENPGAVDVYDGGKGSDTLVIKLTAQQFAEHAAELADLQAWVAENANDHRAASHGFNGHHGHHGGHGGHGGGHGADHPVFETSFGLTVRNIENLQIEIAEPEPQGVVIDLGGADAPPLAPSEVTAITAGSDGLSAAAVNVTLVPGASISFGIDVTAHDLPPLYDVLMVQDLTGSFYNDLANVRGQFSSLYDSLTAANNVNFGVGSFVDKPISPFGSPGYQTIAIYGGESHVIVKPTDYVYTTELAVSGDKAAIQQALDGLNIYSGSDLPESQLEALVQTALRDSEIGFRAGAQKFVVLSTDAAYHMAGDYATAPANNYDTVLGDEDYPDPARTGELLAAAGITPIFAVTADQIATYQALVDSWGFGVVTLLSSDSSNITSAITSGLYDAPMNLSVSVLGDDYGYVSAITPTRYDDVAPGTYTFDITLDVSADLLSWGSDLLTLEIPGYGTVAVNVTLPQNDASGTAGDDVIIGDGGSNGLYGLAGIDTLNGGGGDDIVVGGIDNDMLSGGLGNDVFIYATGDSRDVITDFSAGGVDDSINLGALATVAGFDDVMALAHQVGGDVAIDFGGGDAITLIGVTLADLTTDDFSF